MTTYFGILTKIGEAKEANAKALGVPVNITELEVGDGGGVLPVPSREQTSLIGSKHRAPVNRKFVDPNNPAWLVVEQVIPEQFGGWWARELGLRDADGDLIAVSNCPPTYKPQMAEGSARTQVVRMVLQVSSTSNFTLKIDPAVVLATREYVDLEAAKKLGKEETAVAAKKLSTARNVSITGGVTAPAKSFDGTGDIALDVTEIDVSKANKGMLPVARGGSGLASATAGSFLVGAGTQPYALRTPAQVLQDISGAPLKSPDFTDQPKAPTPERFDSSKLIATTEFVQRALGGMSATRVIDASRVLNADDVNTYLAVAGGVTLSLPPVAAVPAGAVIEMGLTGSGITVTSSENKILLNAAGATTGSVPVRGGSHARFLCTGSFWIFLGPASFAWDSGFSSSLITNGHQALPSGFIIQQGITGNISPGSNVTVTLPRAFPNASLNFFASVTVASNSNTPAGVSGQFISNTQGRVYNWSANTTLAAAWLAVGF
ncbi:phage tail protein [Achromobacter ruhlandii]|uniref:phage tail protein n=1 Tax=Achromobacter ruhlandii TaxID=72557 RepID=UPI0007BFE731|nr:phage tail protein [Achromobacter ruhlandii]